MGNCFAVDSPTVTSLQELAELTKRTPEPFVRWSEGPEADLRQHTSFDELLLGQEPASPFIDASIMATIGLASSGCHDL